MKRNPIYILTMKIGSLEMKKNEMKYWKMMAPHSKDFEVFLLVFFSELDEEYVVLYQSSQTQGFKFAFIERSEDNAANEEPRFYISHYLFFENWWLDFRHLKQVTSRYLHWLLCNIISTNLPFSQQYLTYFGPFKSPLLYQRAMIMAAFSLLEY